jgi:hypothetical protein
LKSFLTNGGIDMASPAGWQSTADAILRKKRVRARIRSVAASFSKLAAI